MNSHIRATVIAVAFFIGLGAGAAHVAAQPTEQVIKITAKKFDYTPNHITLKKGVPVVLEFTTADVLMGFNVPDLGVRADIVPGKVVRLRIVPDKVGSFTFFCDIFCGSGHEDMTGTITVIE
jgi:cytochrome c oxidase subunit 2